MRREHRAGGKGEAKDERKTVERSFGRGGKVGNPALPLHKDKGAGGRRTKGGGGGLRRRNAGGGEARV